MKNKHKFIDFVRSVGMRTLFLILAFGCQHTSTNKHKRENIPVKSIYTCPMPQDSVFSDTPGTCHKCGMELIKMQEMEVSDTIRPRSANIEELSLPTSSNIKSNIRVIQAISMKKDMVVKAHGYISYNPKNISSIASRYEGRIEKLYLNYNFQFVSRGQKILDIYSPEIQSSANEYIYLLKSGKKNTIEGQSTKGKLIQLGVAPDQIQNIESTMHIGHTISIYAPISGHIHEMIGVNNISNHALEWPSENSNVSLANDLLQIRKGGYLRQGQSIFNIVSTNSVWILLKIPSNEIKYIKKGQQASINLESYPGEVFSGRVYQIQPEFQSNEPYYTVRVVMDDCNHERVKIGSFANAEIRTGYTSGIWVPNSAIVVLGKRKQIVFVKSGAMYTARQIKSGASTQGYTQVISGLVENELIATEAHYLVDSESFINNIASE